METGRYNSPYEYIKLSPVKSAPKPMYRNVRVDSLGPSGLFAKEELMGFVEVLELIEEVKKKRRGSRIGKPAD